MLSPTELVQRAVREGLRTLALTDHDTTAGLPEALAAADGVARLIPAIELTCRVRAGTHGTVHVLGYGIDAESSALQDVARANRAAKRAQIRETLAALQSQEGLVLTWDEVSAGRGDDAYVGRHHVASVLVRRGVVKSRLKAFRRYLRSDRVPIAEVVSAEDGMAAIAAAGGVAVLAHPSGLDLKHHFKPLLALGLRGLEVHRARGIPAHKEKVERLAERHGLLISGGSDWHGHHPEPHLGTWRPPVEKLTPFLETLGLSASGTN